MVFTLGGATVAGKHNGLGIPCCLSPTRSLSHPGGCSLIKAHMLLRTEQEYLSPGTQLQGYISCKITLLKHHPDKFKFWLSSIMFCGFCSSSSFSLFFFLFFPQQKKKKEKNQKDTFLGGGKKDGFTPLERRVMTPTLTGLSP